MIYLQLLFSFMQVGLFSIGGGYAAIPLIQYQAVDLHGWLSMSEFTDLITIAEMTPGPIAVNSATFVGTRMAGVWGAVVATLGCVLPSMLLVSVLAYVYYRFRQVSALQNVLASLRPVVVALIASAGLSILMLVLWNGQPISLSGVDYASGALFLVAFVLLRRFRLNPILVMALCGAAHLVIH